MFRWAERRIGKPVPSSRSKNSVLNWSGRGYKAEIREKPGKDEGGRAPQIEFPRANAIHQPSVQPHDQCQLEQVTAGDPLDGGQRSAEICCPTRERYVHHR